MGEGRREGVGGGMRERMCGQGRATRWAWAGIGPSKGKTLTTCVRRDVVQGTSGGGLGGFSRARGRSVATLLSVSLYSLLLRARPAPRTWGAPTTHIQYSLTPSPSQAFSQQSTFCLNTSTKLPKTGPDPCPAAAEAFRWGRGGSSTKATTGARLPGGHLDLPGDRMCRMSWWGGVE